MVQQKRDLLACYLKEPQDQGHQWAPFRSGVQCSQCKQRYHTKSLLKHLREGLTTPCSQAVATKKGKKTWFEVTHDLIESQGDPRPGTHHFRLEKAYLRCSLRGNYVLARAGEDTFNLFLGEVCHTGPIDRDQWSGHPTHQMTRTGNTVECSCCHQRSRVYEAAIILTQKLRAACSNSGFGDLRKMLA